MFKKNLNNLLWIGGIVLLGNWVSVKIPPWEALPGLLILLAMVGIACLLNKITPFTCPLSLIYLLWP